MTSNGGKHEMGSLLSSGDSMKGRRECMDSRRIDVSEELGCYVATELGSSSVARMCVWSLCSNRATLFGIFSDVSCFVRKVLPIVLGLSVVRSSYSSLSVAGLDTCQLPWDSRYLIQSRLKQGIDSIVTDFDPNRSVVSGLLALLKVERDKIGAAPYDGCLRTLVEGIKPFVVRLEVKKEDYELSSRNLTLCELLYP
ncbi:hypothetical protein DY000_02007774 [Brassica cretica]|uniref:Uncharacterized protein n=1 Tax=Brassica cretica TaxID=69181 RepID=A0ABQ7CKY2_BRACR|nr:hypothetical protein DY000_02007774 [Brassica cretica]